MTDFHYKASAFVARHHGEPGAAEAKIIIAQATSATAGRAAAEAELAEVRGTLRLAIAALELFGQEPRGDDLSALEHEAARLAKPNIRLRHVLPEHDTGMLRNGEIVGFDFGTSPGLVSYLTEESARNGGRSTGGTWGTCSGTTRAISY